MVTFDYSVAGIGAGFAGSIIPLGAVEKASMTEVTSSVKHRV